MPYLTWLADVLRGAGLPVREVDGWRTRGHGAMNPPRGVLCHHTAGPATGNYPSEKVVVNGRAGLPGPLANLGLARDGTWIVISAGQAWHAGTGSMPWVPANQGNSHLIGVEAESVGVRDDWTSAQRENYPRGVASLLRHLGLSPERAIAHLEWAPGRKIDPAFWDMNTFRADVARWMNTTATVQEDDLPTPAEVWDYKIADPYVPPGDPAHMKPARDLVGWSATHAAVGRSLAQEAVKAVAALQKRVDQLAATPSGVAAGPVQLSDADVQRIANAVLAELAKRAAS